MMEHTEVRDSPYITNFDLVPPSPTRSNNLGFDHTSPFESSFNNNALTSPTFPHTPSYNGSYYNSPYSQHSELAELDFLSEFPSAPGSGINPEYEPSEYDAPNSGNDHGNSLLMFSNDNEYMSPPLSGATGDAHRGRMGSPFDHGSPASSAGGDDNNGATHGRHSRASSVASHHNPHLQSPSPQPQGLTHSPQPNFHPSPRLDVVNSFGNMSVHTPNWGTQPLPHSTATGGHSPHMQSQGLPQGGQKPLSPPRLSMPPAMTFDSEPTAVPTINAPDGGDGHDNNRNGGGGGAGNGPGGPMFNLVPATPVSGGLSHVRQAVPFQQSLGTLPQGVELGTPEEHQQPGSQQHSRQPSPYSSPNPPSHVPTGSNDFLFAADGHDPRQRRNSDTWTGGSGSFGGNNSGQNQLGLSVSEYAFQQGQAQAQAQAQAQQGSQHVEQHHRQQLQTFSFGGGQSNTGANNASNNFLTATNPDAIRRSVSDSLTAPPRMHGRSRSEDVRSPVPSFSSPPNANAGSAGGFQPHHGQSNSIAGSTAGSAYLFPPSAHTDFLQRAQQQQNSSQQFLHPHDVTGGMGLGVPGAGTRRSLSPMGHIRRASSGSRSGRGAEVWGTTAPDHEGPGGGTLGTRRMSPYPTPNASPRVTYGELDEVGGDLGVGMGSLGLGSTGQQQTTLGGGLGPASLGLGSMGMGGNGLGVGNMGMGVVGIGVSSMGVDGIAGIGEPPVSAGYTEEVSITGQRYLSNNGGTPGHQRDDSANSINGDASSANGGAVAKQNVTTGRTANASIRRRKQEAHFACTVPGCGSTFTRGFNLKGHMRSHYEQKPYKCHWPGCDKGFARQHDCKRHEQLHSNYRPFVCDGCGKNFARMDALNRHLRSEAGVECARAVEEKKENGGSANGDAMEEDDDEKKPGLTTSAAPPQPRRRNTGGLGAASMGIGNPGLGMESGDTWSVSL